MGSFQAIIYKYPLRDSSCSTKISLLTYLTWWRLIELIDDKCVRNYNKDISYFVRSCIFVYGF